MHGLVKGIYIYVVESTLYIPVGGGEGGVSEKCRRENKGNNIHIWRRGEPEREGKVQVAISR